MYSCIGNLHQGMDKMEFTEAEEAVTFDEEEA